MRDAELPASLCDTEMLCIFKYYKLEPYPQFFPGFFVHTILMFVVKILLQIVQEGMTYFSFTGWIRQEQVQLIQKG
jgi:hypothetical protein